MSKIIFLPNVIPPLILALPLLDFFALKQAWGPIDDIF